MPGVRVVEEPFCQLNGFSMAGGNELSNVLLFVPLVFFAVLATRKPLVVLVSAIGLSAAIELLQVARTEGCARRRTSSTIPSVPRWPPRSRQR
ncbi:VanZ family protein [Saccharopolyspora sp. 6V]|uniref:VanZ family protein n=1 Tax=Saccharopolyspora sp. 6V TaxID=2877239 RepID=UPI001CD72CF7|nr:VanZ family protein [Saccharopolyspora sp. 6V]MCA1192109.1 VanZ family protein [Saccharopolyspora sp. 6V]